MKKHGIVIYTPEGAAAEYAKWACNLYNGCSNKCDYCYNRHSRSKNLVGKDEITPKKGYTDEQLFTQFKKELDKWRELIIADGGLHFNFVSDPCLPETYMLNLRCIKYSIEQCVPVQILTKMHEWVTYPEWRELIVSQFLNERRSLIKFGFTLTGMDELEPGASTNAQRIEAMQLLHNFGYQTWASIEPVINIPKAYIVINKAWSLCEEFRIGLVSGRKKEYSPEDVRQFIDEVDSLNVGGKKTIIRKNSVLNFINK